MTMMRTLESHASQVRSLNSLCIDASRSGSAARPFPPPLQLCAAAEPGNLRPSARGRVYPPPESLAIMLNSGMYSEMTMPPTATPRKAIIIGSSRVSKSLVAASTSSS